VLVHTVPPLVAAFTEWSREILPDVRLLHVLDEPILERIRRRGARSPEDDERLAGHIALAEDIGASQPNISQHLAVLRTAGLVDAERDGREVRYRLSDPDVMVACGIMRAVLTRRLSRLGRISTADQTLAELVELQ